MNNKYVIQWKSKVNGRAGRGTKRFDRDEGEELVQELNRDYPDIEHELAGAEGRSPTPLTSQLAGESYNEENENSPVESPHVISFDT